MEDHINYSMADSPMPGPATGDTAGGAPVGTISSTGVSTGAVNGAASKHQAQSSTVQRLEHHGWRDILNSKQEIGVTASVLDQPYSYLSV